MFKNHKSACLTEWNKIMSDDQGDSNHFITISSKLLVAIYWCFFRNISFKNKAVSLQTKDKQTLRQIQVRVLFRILWA